MANITTNNFGAGGFFTLTSHVKVSDAPTLDGIKLTGETILGHMNAKNQLHGSSANDHVVGGNLHDIINGEKGDDVLTGGGGNDTFVFNHDSGNDVITDFSAGDKIDIRYYLRHGADVTVSDTSEGAVIDLGAHNSITLLGVPASDLTQTATGFAHAQLLVS